MNLITAPMQSCVISSEESYCSPWDLKIQEEKFKLLNEQHKPFHRTYSVRPSSRKKSFTHRKLSPPVLPPLPPGGLIPTCLCITNNNTEKLNSPPIVPTNTDTSRRILFPVKSPLNKRVQKIESMDNRSRSNNSLSKIQSAYDQPWDILQTPLINNLHGRSLQKIPNSKQNCSSPTFPNGSLCHYSDNTATLSIDRYFWYHYAMSRRQAEHILETRPSGSFLVRQSESGNQNDYSLSIKTINGCMHMRISYSDGFYILGECSRPFSSVSCMIKYFSHTSVPIRGAAHIKLGTPILRWEILSASLSNEELL